MRSPQTKEAYSKRWRNFVDQVKKTYPHLTDDAKVTTAVVARVVAKRPRLRTSAYRQYRQAALFGIDATVSLGETERAMLIAQLYESASLVPADRLPATSSHKAKSLSEQDWSRLVSYLHRSTLVSDELLLKFLEANRASRLRPIELNRPGFAGGSNS